jgi:SpoVK/Ycf46/Vps4 family AAA+-type ATPase
MKLKVANIALIWGAFFALTPSFSYAELYTCKDATGRVITSDRPIPECAERAVKVLRNNGQFQREIPAPPTEEDKRKAQIEQEKQKNDLRAEEIKQKEERYLQAHYSSEKDIELMRSRSLDELRERIRLGKEQMTMVSQILAQLQAEQQNNTKRSATEVSALQHRASEMERSIKKTKSINDAYEAELVRINAQYDETLKRYREIMNKKR